MTRPTPKIAALRTLLLLTLIAIAGVARANTYYIDYAAGSNSNAGTSQAAPWKSAPGMQTGTGCAGATHSYTHVSGDKFIFKGGSTWPTACFEINLTVGGTSTAQDYWGVCLATDSDSPCFSGTSWPSTGWTRPIWGGSHGFLGSGDNFFHLQGASDFSPPSEGYITIDNIEIANWNVVPQSASNGNTDQSPAIVMGCALNYCYGVGTVVENVYIHDWVADTSATPGSTDFAYGMVYGTGLLKNSTISDQLGHYKVNGTLINWPFMGGCAGCIEVKNDKFAYLWMGCSSVLSCHDSEFDHMEEDTSGLTYNRPTDSPAGLGIHSHAIYDDAAAITTHYVYNNWVHDGNAALVVQVFYEAAIFNNVISNMTGNAAIYLDQCEPGLGSPPCGDNSSQVGYVANNIIDMSATTMPCYKWFGSAGLGAMNFKNNICIPSASGGTGSFSVATLNASNNRNLATSEASTYGFTAPNKYSPSSADPFTAGQGANLTTSCSSNLAALCQDTSGAPWFGGAYKTRPTGATAWDMGAFQGQGGTTGPPSISISSPSPGTISGSVNLTASCTPQGSATVSSIQFTIDGFPFGAAGTSSPYTLSWNTTTAANANHVIGATCTDSNAQVGTAGTVTVTVSDSIPGCFISTDNGSGSLSWTANQAFTAQSANFTATVTITPNTANQDTVFALSQSPMNVYGQGAAVLRANSSGFWDVWKGSTGYTSDNSAPYTAGTAYSFTFTINFTGPNAGTFSVAETSPSSIAIATNYAFRATASIASLGFINSIADDDTPDTQKACNFQVGGAASLTFSPLSLNFGNITVGSNATQTITPTTSGGSVNFSSVAISGNADFTINSNSCSGSVPSSCTTQIKFAPTSAALETATVTFTDDATGSPQSVAVSGTGVPATPTLSVSPTSVNFGGVQVHTTSSSGPIVLTISSGPVTFTGTPSLSGPNAADFALASNTCTGTVSASSCQSVVSFTPSAVGAESATLSYSDSATGSPQAVALTGSGYLAPHPPTAAQPTVQ